MFRILKFLINFMLNLEFLSRIIVEMSVIFINGEIISLTATSRKIQKNSLRP